MSSTVNQHGQNAATLTRFLAMMLTAVLITGLSIAAKAQGDMTASMPERWAGDMPDSNAGEIRTAIFDSMKAGDWLQVGQLSDALRAKPKSYPAQFQAFAYEMLGRADLVVEMVDRGLLYKDEVCPAVHSTRPALDAILARIKEGAQIVILNENHVKARDRMSLHLLLAPLRKAGFSYLAVEDFEHAPKAYETARFPGDAPAFHSAMEPVFADAVRTAIALGYRLIPHEIDFSNFEEIDAEKRNQYREDQQAQNLIDLVLANDPDARILVHVGFNHAYEAEWDALTPPLRSMALRLKEKTGLDPLTIDQTGCAVAARFDGPGPVGFDADGAPVIAGIPAGKVDLQLRHGAEDFPNGRAHWLKSLGRKPVRIPQTLRDGEQPVVIEAHHAEEPMTAAPADRLYLAAGEDMPLMLRPGSYRVRAQTAAGWSAPVDIQVDG